MATGQSAWAATDSEVAAAEVTTVAPAGGCAGLRHPGLPEGPVAIGLLDGALGAARRACPRTEVAIGLGGGAIIDTPGFYGNLAAALLVEGSVAIGRRGEVFVTVPVIDWQYAVNASLTGSDLAFGAISLGGSWLAMDGSGRGGLALAPYARVLVPTDGRTLGGELGAALTLRGTGRLSSLAGHAAVAGQLSGGVAAGPADLRGGALVVAGMEWTPSSWFALAIDLHLHMGWRDTLDWIGPAAALRFRIWRTLGAELAGLVPLAGADRHDAGLLVRLGWRI